MPDTSSGPRPYNADSKTFGPAVAAAKTYKAGNTCRELQTLIRTRLCFTPPSHWRKDRCVAILVRDDMEQLKWPFSFLELPPELRNMVYRQLLHIPLRQEDRMRASDSWISRDDISCHPKILAASKQIQAEAKGILYGENVRKMYIVCAGFERVELEPGDYVTISASRYPFANVMQHGRRSEDWVNSISGKLGWNTRQKQKSFDD